MFEERVLFVLFSFLISFLISWLFRKKRTSFSDAYIILLNTSLFSFIGFKESIFSVFPLLLLSFSLLFFSKLRIDSKYEKLFLFFVCLLGTYCFYFGEHFLFRVGIAFFWSLGVLSIRYFDRVNRLSWIVLSTWGIASVFLLFPQILPLWLGCCMIILTSSLSGNVYGSQQKKSFVLGNEGALSIGFLYSALPVFLLSKGYIFSSVMYFGFYLTELSMLLIMGLLWKKPFNDLSFLIEKCLLKQNNTDKFYRNLFQMLFLFLFLNVYIAILGYTKFTFVSVSVMLLFLSMIFIEPNNKQRVGYRQLFSDVFDGMKVLGGYFKKSLSKQK